jgi:NADPH2:quinone reductase
MKHSKAVVGFWLFHCLADPQRLVADPLADLLSRAAAGDLRVVEGEVYPLAEARRAHEDLGARRTTGKLLLDPRF